MRDKKVSIIMGIYNCADTLPEAIDSLIAQTYDDWELIMCDDGSTDKTYMVADSYAKQYPQRMTLIRNEKNQGLNFTLNRCLSISRGEYIARMDGDDVSSADRFEKEASLLDKYLEFSIVSSDMEFFDEHGLWGRTAHKEKPAKEDFLQGTPFCHAACMVRREAFMAVDGYSVAKRLLRVEDYHLWVKMYAQGYVGINIQEPLYKMRDDRNALNRKKFRYRVNEAYVKAIAVRSLGLPFYRYVHCAKPILIGLLPKRLFMYLHKRKYRVKT